MNNLSDEPPFKTKTDVLDLLISFLREHEKQMDHMLQRLEKIAETLPKRERHVEQLSVPPPSEKTQPRPFTLTITNPEHFEDVKSLNIEWGRERGAITNTRKMRT